MPDEAKRFYLGRITEAAGRSVGLREEDLSDTFTMEDWINAFEEVAKGYDKEDILKKDRQIAQFADRYHRHLMGLVQNIGNGHHQLRQTMEELAARARRES